MIRIWFIVLIWLPFAALAQEFPEPISPYVNDFATVLDADSTDRVSEVLIDLRENHGVEATLITMGTKAQYWPDRTLEDFATALFDRWGIGDASRNDGILLLYLHDDREVRIELGKAYGQDWNHWAAIVVDDVLVPNFKAGRTEVGLVKGVEAMRDEIALPFVRGEDAPQYFGSSPQTDGSDRRTLSEYIPFLFISFVVGLLGYNAFRGLDRFRRCPNCKLRGHVTTQKIPDEGGFDPKYRTGTLLTDCANCGYHGETRFMHRKSTSRGGSSGSSGSSGSFGGGSSGGGGASGRW